MQATERTRADREKCKKNEHEDITYADKHTAFIEHTHSSDLLICVM